ncbi:MAG: 2'-5' RNA ligase family protein [Chloroflexota bacterium]
MDGYAVELGFEPKAAQKIRKIQTDLAAAGLHSEFTELQNQPHITLTAFHPKIDKEKLQAVTAAFSQSIAPFDVTFTSIAQFATAQNVVYLAPLTTMTMMEMYQAFQDQLSQADLEPGFYYRPGSWIPHTTITMKGPKADLGPTVDLIRKAPVFNRPMTIDRINLVWYAPFNLIQTFPLT